MRRRSCPRRRGRCSGRPCPNGSGRPSISRTGGPRAPIESLLRLGLVRAGIAFDLQVWVVPFHRVDFLLGDRLVVEVDGRRFHDDPDAFERDRERDALLALWGFRVLRFTYRQVTEDLAGVLDVIRTVQAVQG